MCVFWCSASMGGVRYLRVEREAFDRSGGERAGFDGAGCENGGTGAAIGRWGRAGASGARSADGSRVAVIDLDMRVGGFSYGSAHGITVWEVRSGKKIMSMKSPVSGAMDAAVGGLAFSPEGTRLALAGSDGVLHLYAVPTGEEVGKVKVEGERLQAVRFIDAETVCAGSGSGIVLWKVGEAATRLWNCAGAVHVRVGGLA